MSESTNAFRFQLFGPAKLFAMAGHELALRSRKQLALLAYLATHYRRAHSREALLNLFWPDEETSSAQNNLRVILSRIRALAVDAPLLIVDRNSIQFNPAWVERVDYNQVSQLIEQTNRHGHAARSRCTECQQLLARAVALIQGELLAGLGLEDCDAFEEWLTRERERIPLMRLEAYADLASYAEAQADLASVYRYTQHQIEIDGLCEPAYRQQMRILALQGQRSAALVCFERLRTLLNDELGLDPEPETLALHAQLLTGTFGNTAIGQITPQVPQPATSQRFDKLPLQLTPFFGREEELTQLQARLSEPGNRLVSIVGPGGIGKSRLALQVATQVRAIFRDGVAFTSLAPITGSASIPSAIAETLGFELVASQQHDLDQLIRMLGTKHILLILDNFEHLIDATDMLITLLQRAPHVVLLVTSRERLHLQAEDLFEVQGLPTPASNTDRNAMAFASIRLFVDRACRLNKRFMTDESQIAQIAQICKLLDGFPLAIELAASWAHDLSCTEIGAELQSGVGGLATTMRDVAPHHRSLRAVFTTSWQRLSQHEQHVLMKLTIFRGGFSLEAAQTIAEATPATINRLQSKSLLRRAGSRRYDMHMLVQQFAAELLYADGEAAKQATQRHQQYFLGLLAEQSANLDTSLVRAAADRVHADWENISSAWQQASTHLRYDMLHAALDGIVRFCDLRGLFQEAQTLLDRTTNQLTADYGNFQQIDGTSQLRLLYCRCLTALAFFANRRGQEQALACSQAALVLAEELNSPVEVITNLLIHANSAEIAAEYASSRSYAERALQIARRHKLEIHAALCLSSLGLVALLLGEFEHAQQLYTQVLAIHQRTGQLEQPGREAIGRLGAIATEQGRYDLALQHLDTYLASCRHVDDRRSSAHALHHLAFVWLRLGEYARVIELERESVAISKALGDRELTSLSLHNKAHAHRALAQLPEALACAAEAVALAREADARLALAYALGQFGEVYLQRAQPPNDREYAATYFREAATSFRSFSKLVQAYEAEIGLAELAYRCGNFAEARSQIDPILPSLPCTAADGWDEPVRAYLVCSQILRATNDPMAQGIAKQGRQLLRQLASNINDVQLRQGFLKRIAAHRKLAASSEVS